MREVTYYLADNCGNIILMKRVRDPKKGIFTGYIWGRVKKKWVEAWELCCDYFYGYEPAKVTDEEGAKKYMIETGTPEEEAAEFIKKDKE